MRIASGASCATPLEPSAPAIAGSAAKPNTTQGISARRRRAGADRFVDNPLDRAVPGGDPEEIGHARQQDEQVHGKAGVHLARRFPHDECANENVITIARTPRLIGRRVPMMKITTSLAIPVAWTDKPPTSSHKADASGGQSVSNGRHPAHWPNATVSTSSAIWGS
jgi:hypothetical protein